MAILKRLRLPKRAPRVMVNPDPPLRDSVAPEFLFEVWRLSPGGVPMAGVATTPEAWSQIARAWLCGFNWAIAPRRMAVA